MVVQRRSLGGDFASWTTATRTKSWWAGLGSLFSACEVRAVWANTVLMAHCYEGGQLRANQTVGCLDAWARAMVG